MTGALTVLVPLAVTLAAMGAMADAQQDSRSGAGPRPVLSSGERLVYDVKYGPLRVGEGSMEVVGVETIRGRAAWHTRFQVKGGVFFYKVDDLLESWIDTGTFHTLRFLQDLEEGGRTRQRSYEIFPERQSYRENDSGERPSVSQPLDEGSFLYFIRSVPLEVGRSYDFDRYFRPDRNPVTLRVLRRERVTVPAGTFDALVIQPIIRSPRGIFSEGSRAEVWISDDVQRIMVQMRSRTSIGSLSLYLKSYRPGSAP